MSGKSKKAKPKLVATPEPATAPTPEPKRAQSRDYGSMGHLGGLTRVSRLTPEQISAEMSERSKVRWSRERARRAAEGTPMAPRPQRKGPSAKALKPFLEAVMKAHPEWGYAEQHRQAVVDFKLYIARMAFGGDE
ncbi:hypothetical protein [Rathayibacter sp. AY1H2]|uniref:hypothetical protein n=1 Tax=Rathayibacter sp. AY1H2 TaxID=2080566 RepID=UPI0015E34A1B|nr:hypothetical protein [Rathayibacter sp. AY1H2]